MSCRPDAAPPLVFSSGATSCCLEVTEQGRLDKLDVQGRDRLGVRRVCCCCGNSLCQNQVTLTMITLILYKFIKCESAGLLADTQSAPVPSPDTFQLKQTPAVSLDMILSQLEVNIPCFLPMLAAQLILHQSPLSTFVYGGLSHRLLQDTH